MLRPIIESAFVCQAVPYSQEHYYQLNIDRIRDVENLLGLGHSFATQHLEYPLAQLKKEMDACLQHFVSRSHNEAEEEYRDWINSLY